MEEQNIRQHRYIEFFGITVMVLALVRCAFPSTLTVASSSQQQDGLVDSLAVASGDSVATATKPVVYAPRPKGGKYHRILSVTSFKTAFPDTNALQLTAAQRWGVTPVKNREDAERRKTELVFVGASPYYHVDHLRQSIPYLVPRAAILLEDIGKAFFDSLQIKGIPLHRFIVTSVLRTQADVKSLRNINGNATENSCHLYGTTFDICYNRYETVEHPDGPRQYPVRNDSLKYVLSEVLRDLRQQQRCYIKYEVKQGCFHMTVR